MSYILPIPVKIKLLRPTAKVPVYKTDGAAGADLFFAPVDGRCCFLEPGERQGLELGIAMEIPEGYEVQIRPRSGLAVHNGITVLNSPSTIDSDYRGEWTICLINLSQNFRFIFNPGDRVAQMVLKEVPKAVFLPVEELSTTKRGEAGWGSTGLL